MVALQALSQYSLRVGGTENNLMVTVGETPRQLAHAFRLEEDNKLLLQRRRVAELPAGFNVAVEGTGCFMVQTVLR